MEEKGLFRTAIGGFNKADVLNYIDSLTAAWNVERELLENQARADRETATTANARVTALETETAEKLAEMQAETEAMRTEAQEARDALEQMQTLAEQAQALSEQVAQMREELAEALVQNNRMQTALAQSEEKSQSARAEMMAAEDRLQTRETELTRRNERLAALETQLARYEAVLGHSDGMKEHIDDIVRPFTETAARRAEDTLDDTYAVIAALLAQLGELQNGIEEQKRALRQEKAENDAKLNRVLGGWFTKAKELAESAAQRTTHFFR